MGWTLGKRVIPSAWESERIPNSNALETSIRMIRQTICRVFRMISRDHPLVSSLLFLLQP